MRGRRRIEGRGQRGGGKRAGTGKGGEVGEENETYSLPGVRSHFCLSELLQVACWMVARSPK